MTRTCIVDGPCAVYSRVYKHSLLLPTDSLTTLALWLRSSVVSVLNSLTTIMGAPPSLLVILFLQPLFPGALLATLGRDDLASALLACVVGGPIPFTFLLPFIHLVVCCVPFGNFHRWQIKSLEDLFTRLTRLYATKNYITFVFWFFYWGE